MQLTLNFSSFLASVFLVLLIANPSDGSPLNKRKPKSVTLPLKRIPSNPNVHPLIALQQQVNRADKRLARMTRRDAPSELEMKKRLHKRVADVESGQLTKRFNRSGVSSTPKSKRFNHSGLPKPAPVADTDVNSFNAAAGGKGIGVGKNSGDIQGSNASNTGNTGKGAASGAGAAASGAIGGPDSANGVEVANTPSTANSLGLSIEGQDTGYLAPIPIGTPPQNFAILMDSGSADFWVGSEQCQGDQGGDCGNHQFLGTKASSSFKDTGTPFEVTYGTGQVSGNIITDNIDVAGLKLTGHTFGVATTESVDFSADTTSFDGLMGLAQSTLSNQKVLTPVEALAKQGLISDAITSYKIARAADNKNDGEITFGALDQTKFDAKTLTTVKNVNADGFWEADMDAVSVDGQDAGLQGRTAILDTGTTLIIAPEQDATTILSAIDGASGDAQNGFTVPCDTKASVALTFGGTSFAIESQDLAAGQADPNDPTTCLSGIQAGNIGGAQEWLVGDVFLKNAYFSTDVGKNQLSLAKLV